MSAGSGPTIAMRTNPIDPYSKVLVLTGDNADDLVIAATALAMQRDMLQSDQVRIPSLKMPAPREPDDAPRWLSTDKITPLGRHCAVQRAGERRRCTGAGLYADAARSLL